MVPNPQDVIKTTKDPVTTPQYETTPMDGHRIVISGMGGLYPQARNVQELSEILYEKKNPVTSEDLRWTNEHPELGQFGGQAPDMERFDAQFFMMYSKLACNTDPMSRKLFETTYSALYDAGISPSSLNGKNVAVYMGSSQSDSEIEDTINNKCKTGVGLLGGSRAMFANRISYWLNIKGPSLFIDEGDCSASTALEQGYLAIKRGYCEAAIVGSSNLCLLPQSNIHYGRTGLLSKDGKTKSYCQDSSGYVRSDAINVLILQKAEDAFRVYAELLHVKNEFISLLSDTTGPKYGFSRDPEAVTKFIKQFYEESGVSTQAVEYVEGYGTAVPDADKAELEALEKAYCYKREEPLLIGSVTSNIGLTCAASGITAVTKVLLGYHTGKLAANLNCSPIRQDINAIREGRMRVLTEHQPFRQTYTAINGMSIGGVNSHILLHGKYKAKNLKAYKSAIPRLVAISGRQESFVQNVIDYLKSKPTDAEQLALLHNIHSTNITGHLARGYVILDSDENNKTMCLSENTVSFDDARRPLWFVYSGMGSQWPAMGAKLMRIPVFATAIERCHKVLEPTGLNIYEIITSKDKSILDDILCSFLGISAIQIGLTDVLHEIGLVPDGIIGHSVGELGAAYADGCLTAEEMIMAAYARGRASRDTELIHGSMAAVGLGYEKISKLCPPEIDVACHNSADSCTISGPTDIMRTFVTELTAQGVFAKEVTTSNIAYHSRYIANAGPVLLKYLKVIIKDPKLRSSRWLSTSMPQDKWDDELAKYCSAEYQVNNLLSPVLFEETARLIPSNAVLVEIAPHGLLQAILKRSMPASCEHVALARRGHPDNIILLLEAVGSLYMAGYTPKIQALYPKIQFPVSTGTPMLSHLVDWYHTEKWPVVTYTNFEVRKATARKIVLSIFDDEYSYLQGHVVREKVCFPFAATLVAVWDTLAMHLGVPKQKLSVQFHDVHLYAQPILLKQRPLRLYIALHRGTGKFEVVTGISTIVSGFIEQYSIKNYQSQLGHNKIKEDELGSEDFYQLLRDREYKYSGEFRSIDSVSPSLTSAQVLWRDNWVTLIDGLLQLNVLRQPHSAVSQPTHIKRLVIDVKAHNNGHTLDSNGKSLMTATLNHHITKCGGVSMETVQFENLPPLDHDFRKLSNLGVITNSTNALHQETLKQDVKLQITQVGDLESLQWVEIAPLKLNNLNVEVHYAGLNESDLKRATGVNAYDGNNFGMDYSGITNSGVRVMGIVPVGAASSRVAAVPELLWPVPSYWSLEDAATVPLAYAHAFYCLTIKGNLQPGMSVLVHGGLGGLGQAAIRIALAHDCQVFATVGDIRKQKFLQKLFPQLTDAHIGNSRDNSVLQKVIEGTKGQGCDIVISCVKAAIKQMSLNCLAHAGILIDIAHIKDHENYEYGMFNMTKSRSYAISDFSSIFTHKNNEDLKLLQSMLYAGIVKGYVQPLSRVTYEAQEVTRALQHLATGSQRGRVLLRIKDVAISKSTRIVCSPDKNHLMFWDESVFGVQLADRLINRGAKRLFIQTANLSSYHRFKIESWRKTGIEVCLSIKDIMENNAIYNDVLLHGDVESIYFIACAKESADKRTEALKVLLQNVAMLNMYTNLKYVAVVSNINGFAQDISPRQYEILVTNVDLSNVSSVQGASWRDMVAATERSLTGDHTVQTTERHPKLSLLQKIAVLAGITIIDDISHDTTLKELGMLDKKVPPVTAFLRKTYNICLMEDQVTMLTVEKIKDIEDSVTEAVFDDNKGFSTFFSYVDKDELLATADIVALPTRLKDFTKFDNVSIVNEKCLHIVPGMEGNYERFRTLCERLKLSALVLQPGLDRPKETVRETAFRYAQILRNQSTIQDNFYLLGYESGVLVALELAAILEEQGYKGTVFCVGHDPEDFLKVLVSNINEYKTEDQLEEALIRHMIALMTNKKEVNVEDALKSVKTREERVDGCIQTLLGRVTYSRQYMKAYLEAALERVKLVRNYVIPTRTLQSKVILLRASTTQAPNKPNALQNLSTNTIIHEMSSPLSHILVDMECSAIINRHLDVDIMKTFEENNICETYVI